MVSLLSADEEAADFLSRPADLDGSPAAAPVRLAVGTRLGPYEVVSFLGAGGMGEVYKGRDTRLERTVAIKVLPAAAAADASRRRRLEREARTISRLSHPHICALYDVGQDGPVSFLVMEYLEGDNLGQRLRNGPLPLPEALAYATEVAGALAEAHEHGVVHRDLKPGNVILTKKGAKLLDFGIAKLVAGAVTPESGDDAGTSLTGEAIVGTPQYMAPEQLEGGPADARTDVFAFGLVLYEMVAGRKAFESPSDAGLIAAILKGEPPRLRDVRSGVPRRVERIVARCLQKDPARRYASAVEVRRDLEDHVRPAATAPELSPSMRRRRTLAAAAVAALLLIAALGAWTSVRRARAENARNAAVAEMERLVDNGRFVEVWRVGRAALQQWPGDPRIEHPMSVTTQPVTIATEPSGAEVAFKAYEDVAGEWLPLGTTPLRAVRAPVGQLRWRITKDGFEPLEARLEVGAPAAAAGRPDADARPIRLQPVGRSDPRMVFVPGGAHEGVELSDYWIDQTEVTNRAFKAFVDRGGYDDLRGQRGTGAFRDRTGRPGPSTWELGNYPDEKGDHPVNGVSWFEAVAYCRSIGKSLPTVFHWKKAFGASFFVEVLTLGNFSGRGPEDTRELKEVGPYGTYGMAGNVKEWVWNEFEGRRYVLGGAWNEPVYMAVDDDARPPLDRAEAQGFRCIKEVAPSGALAYGAYGSRPSRDFAKEKPVDTATFDAYRRFYSYDRTPLDSRIERTEVAEHWRRERVSFAAAYGGERVLANILLPRNASPPYQAVIWFPGSYAVGLKSSERELAFSYYFDFLPRSGRALVYPVYKGTYERRVPGPLSPSQARDVVVQWSKDLGRTIDYLESRRDIAPDKLAYYGFSMGAAQSLPAVAVEPRLKAAILLAGGMSDSAAPPEIEPLNFLPRIEMPVLLLAGRNDFYFPVDTSQRPMFKLLGAPPGHKRHVVFEGAGHVPPRVDVIREILDWLDRYLGPVASGSGTRGSAH